MCETGNGTCHEDTVSRGVQTQNVFHLQLLDLSNDSKPLQTEEFGA